MKTLGYVKIGITSGDIKNRVSAVQTGCPLFIHQVNFWSVKTRSIAFLIESEIHALLKDRRTHGEWFKNTRVHSSQINKVLSQHGVDFDDIKVIFLGKKHKAERNEIEQIELNMSRALRDKNISRLIGIGKRIYELPEKKRIDDIVNKYKNALHEISKEDLSCQI